MSFMHQCFEFASRCHQLERMIREYENPRSLSHATLERAGNVFLKSSFHTNESNEIPSGSNLTSKSRKSRDLIAQESSKLKQEILSFVFYRHDSGTSIASCMARFLVEHCSLEEVVSVVTKCYWPQESNTTVMSKACISDRHDVSRRFYRQRPRYIVTDNVF